MNTPVVTKRVYRFGLFEADAASGKLLRQGMRVKLQDQPFRVLCLLLERPGQVVTREELRRLLWSENTYVEFDGSLNAALKRLRFALGDSPDNPIFIETLPKRGYRFLAPVSIEESVPKILPIQSDRRDDAPAEEGENSFEEPIPTLEPVKARWPQRIVFGFVLVFIALVGVASYHRQTSAGATKTLRVPPPPLAAPRISVAVIGFNNASGRAEDAWVSTALSEMLNTELASGDKLRLVSGEDVAHLRLAAPWMQTDTLGQDTASRIGLGLSSDVLVIGSYATVGKAGKRQLRVDVRLQDSATGNVLTEVAETDSEDNLFHLASTVGGRLRNRLGLPANTAAEQAAEMESMPSSPEAARLYALGLDKLREFDAQSARDLLQQAAKADPRFPLAHSMLARAWADLGYEQNRRDEAKIALDLSVNLPRVDRMQVEADYYESLSNHEQAASTYRALFALFPDSVEYGLQLASIQTRAGHSDQALETVAQLRRLPPQVSGDPRIDLAEAHATINKPAALILVRNALNKADSQGKKLTYAQARHEECMTLIYGDHSDQALPSCEDAYKTFLAAGNRLAAADSLRLIADRQGAEGHREEAIATYERALHILRELGEHAKTGAVLNNMAINFANQGKLDRAEKFYQQAKYHFEQSGDKNNTATAIGNIADILYLRGNLADATKLYEQNIEIETSLVPSQPGYALYRLADLEMTQGKTKDARKHAEQAVETIRPGGAGFEYLTGAMIVLGDALMAQADLAGARHQYEQSLEIRKKMGEQNLVAENQVSLATLSTEEGHPDQAEAVLREVTPEFEREDSTPDEVSAYVELGRALLLQAKLEEARKAIHHAAELNRGSPNPALTLPLDIVDARLKIAEAVPGAAGRAKLADARRQIESVMATAKKLGYYVLECEARLALAELDRRANAAIADTHLRALAAETQGRGLLLLSRRAASMNSTALAKR
jgi:DNA-binding winged helix-turn-helix (wHTH) protein/tetratricopeptide (TPR) repeat protein